MVSYNVIHITIGRIAMKLQTVAIVFTQRSKMSSFHRFTRHLAWMSSTWVRLAVPNFTSVHRGGYSTPKVEHFHYLVFTPQGRTILPISTIAWGFHVPKYLALVFNIWGDWLHRLQSYCWETVY